MFNLFGKITLDGKGFEAGVRQIDKALGGLKSRIAATLTLGALTAKTAQLSDYARKIQNLSSAFGVSTDALQEFDYIAKKSGSDLDNFIDIIRQLSRNREAALANPATQAALAFQQLGVSIEDLRSKDLISLLTQIGEAFRKANNPQEVMGLGVQALGESSSRIFPAMVQGLSGMRQEAQDLGVVIERDVVANLAEMSNQMSTLSRQFSALLAGPLGDILKVIGSALEQVVALSQATGAFLGTRSVGGFFTKPEAASMENAMKAAREAYEASLERSRKSRTAIAGSDPSMIFGGINNRGLENWMRRQMFGGPGDATEKARVASIFKQNITEAQRVGAFISDRGMLRVADQQLASLRRIEQLLQQPARQMRQESIY